ncbi:H-NS family nucleoid-associated regulatory protein [Burkholderia sp. Bp8986]|uniref:H-NS histone family protein n=1 Tax=Burkholderia sp. Bp8986 TaxID=2184550 RepID=UPI000F5B2569|nr:H-NS histone family protein [Burkholderia sp. Bp8986]RQS44322.1 H-NS histone family protein [Burkholderia sp. Bp8986]
MTTYRELKAQAAALAQQAEEARLAELDRIITTIREQIEEYGITPDQLFGHRRAAASSRRASIAPRSRAPVPPKYRDPKTGATWSGRGKAPRWIASAKNRDRFLISEGE